MKPELRAAITILALTLGAAAHAGAATTPASPPAKPAAARAATPAKARPAAAKGDVLTFGPYQDLLNKHLWTVSDPGKPLETRFNYEYFHDQKGRAERTVRIRQEFLAVDLGTLDLANRRAWAINFYNYLVIETATEHLLIPGKTRQRHLTVQDMRIEGHEFFQFPVVTIDSVSYTLDRFEKHFLFDDYDRKSGSPPPASLDPRLHFAIVCAAIGCPPLQQRAYRADSLELQLDRAVRRTLEHPSHFRHDPGSPAVHLSTLFTWYLADFGGSREAAVRWAAKYLSRERRAALEKVLSKVAVFPIQWDWKLNQVVGWRFHWEMDRGIRGDAAKRDST